MQTVPIKHRPAADLPAYIAYADPLPAASSAIKQKRERIFTLRLRVKLATVLMSVALSGCGVFCGGAGGSGGGFAGGCATGMRF